MTFGYRDKFAQARKDAPNAVEALEDSPETTTAPAGDYTADVTPPAPTSLEQHLEDYKAGVHGPPSEAALEVLEDPTDTGEEVSPA